MPLRWMEWAIKGAISYNETHFKGEKNLLKKKKKIEMNSVRNTNSIRRRHNE